MKVQELKKAVVTASRNGGISCKAALTLAAKLGVTPKRIGDICNELKIKIHSCQLGCFK